MIRLATKDDIDGIMICINDAKGFLRKCGSTQWQGDDGYPRRDTLLTDINNKQAYVCVRNKTICGVSIFGGPESLYDLAVADFKSTTNNYATIHRVAVSNEARGQGVAHELFLACERYSKKNGIDSIRVDTHPNNIIMQHILVSLNYTNVGYVDYPRIKEEPRRLIYEKLIK